MAKKQALGRGLGALLGDSDAVKAEKELRENSGTGGVDPISVDEIEVNPFQPRENFNQEALEELGESIKVHGIIQPITVRKLSAHRYQLISGERRLQASKKAGLTSIPAYIRTANDQQMLEMALIENIQRENLNSIEIALSYQRLISECNLKQEELGGRVGKNRSTVTNYLRLLKLPPDIQIGLRDKTISMGHARAIISVENPDVQLDLYKNILANGLSVRQVESLVRKMGQKPTASSSKKKDNTSSELVQLKSKLTSHFGTRVQIASDGKKGEIKIPFVSVEDLNRILDILDIS